MGFPIELYYNYIMPITSELRTGEHEGFWEWHSVSQMVILDDGFGKVWVFFDLSLSPFAVRKRKIIILTVSST